MGITYEYIDSTKLKDIIVKENKARLGTGGPTFDSVRQNIAQRTNDLLKDEKTKHRVIKSLGGGKYRFQLWHGTSYAWGGVFSATSEDKAKKDIEALIQEIKENKLDAASKKGIQDTLSKRLESIKKAQETNSKGDKAKETQKAS